MVFWAFLAIYLLIAGLWAIGTPPMSSVDEPSHAIKAAAVVRGQLSGDQAGLRVGTGVVQVPRLFLESQSLVCTAGQPEITATYCPPNLGQDLSETVDVTTSAVRYNPLYYAFAGLPSLFGNSISTFYWMRLVGGLLAAWMLALAARSLAELTGAYWPFAALLVSITPMTVFMSASINPQSVELAGAILLWVAVLALLRSPDPDLLHRRLFRLTLATVFVANVRGLGPLLVVVIVLTGLAISRWADIVALLRSRLSWIYGAVCGLSVVAGYAWTVGADTLTMPTTEDYPALTGETILRLTTASTGWYTEQSIGVFGWLEVPMPDWVYLGYAGLVLVIVIAGLAFGRWREQVAIVALACLVVVLPIYAEFGQAHFIGQFWQGRYGLPIAVGVPLVAAFALQQARPPLPGWIGRRVMITVAIPFALLQAHALAVDIRRQVNGLSADSPWFGWADDAWLPPLNPYLMVGACLICWLVLAALLVRAADDSAPPGTPADSDAVPITRRP